MDRVRIAFAALFVLSPVVLNANPVVKIVSPGRSPNTEGVLNASGTGAGVAPFSVHYSLNGSAFLTAKGSYNWSVTNNLALTPGMNTFSVYAEDITGLSRTNTVKFIYVVNVPVTIEIDGPGTVSPITNGEPLEIGKKYSVDVRAAKGFATTAVLLNGNPVANTSHFFFNMESNDIITADFQDATRPTCVILSPAVRQSVSNSPIDVVGKANDNVGVVGVDYQINGGGWNPAVLIDPTNWEATNLTLNVGSNVVQAFAMDAVTNISLTNTVLFFYVSNAPAASLAGDGGTGRD